jgi:hypothetical protein
VFRVANRLFSSRRAATRSKVSSLTTAGTAISIHSSRGRSTVLVGRGVERPSSRARRLIPAGVLSTIVFPNTAFPA